jgi:hypothetical protein
VEQQELHIRLPVNNELPLWLVYLLRNVRWCLDSSQIMVYMLFGIVDLAALLAFGTNFCFTLASTQG